MCIHKQKPIFYAWGIGVHWNGLKSFGIDWGGLEWSGVLWSALGSNIMDWDPAHPFKLTYL